MGWFSDITDFLGFTDTDATNAAAQRAQDAADAAAAAKKKAEAEAAAVAAKEAAYITSMNELATANTSVDLADVNLVVPGGSADTAATDMLQKKKGLSTGLSTSLGITV